MSLVGCQKARWDLKRFGGKLIPQPGLSCPPFMSPLMGALPAGWLDEEVKSSGGSQVEKA